MKNLPLSLPVLQTYRTSRGQKNSSNKMGRKNDEICGTNLLVSSVSQEVWQCC